MAKRADAERKEFSRVNDAVANLQRAEQEREGTADAFDYISVLNSLETYFRGLQRRVSDEEKDAKEEIKEIARKINEVRKAVRAESDPEKISVQLSEGIKAFHEGLSSASQKTKNPLDRVGLETAVAAIKGILDALEVGVDEVAEGEELLSDEEKEEIRDQEEQQQYLIQRIVTDGADSDNLVDLATYFSRLSGRVSKNKRSSVRKLGDKVDSIISAFSDRAGRDAIDFLQRELIALQRTIERIGEDADEESQVRLDVAIDTIEEILETVEKERDRAAGRVLVVRELLKEENLSDPNKFYDLLYDKVVNKKALSYDEFIDSLRTYLHNQQVSVDQLQKLFVVFAERFNTMGLKDALARWLRWKSRSRMLC